ncbi:MAG: mitofilin family membrane protein [Pseudomonadota bacterium]|nr:mitofilin family membrane protein [Pseudomonadota bacterium]
MAKATTPRKTTRTTKARTTKPRSTAAKTTTAAQKATAEAEEVVKDAVEAVEQMEKSATEETKSEAPSEKADASAAEDKAEDAAVSEDTADAAPASDGQDVQAEDSTDSPAEDSTAKADSETGESATDTTPEPVEEVEQPPAEPKDTTPAPAPVIKETIVERKAGFFPMLLGGVAAAVAGFGLSQYLGPNGWPFSDGAGFEAEISEKLSDQEQQINALESQLADLAPRFDGVDGGFAEVQTSLGDIASQADALETTLVATEAQIAALSERMVELEKRPMEAAVSPATIAAYQAELDKLVASVDAERAEMEKQRQEVADLAQRAVEAEQSAQREALVSDLKIATATVIADVNAGKPFAASLEPLIASNIVSVPEGLTSVADTGVPTQSDLLNSFPKAARQALATARASEDDGTRPSLTSYFAAQLGARSVQPREGDDADAVLSRAEAAVANGDLEAAFKEIESLSDDAKADMADWVAAAKTRFDAVSAIQAISAELNKE